MTGSAQKVLAALGACLLAAACSGPNWTPGENNEGAAYLRRWKVTDASGKVLSEGCTQQSSLGPGYAKDVIHVHAVAGTVVSYQDNLGIEYVDKSRQDQNLPTNDAYWCGNQDTVSVDVFSGSYFQDVQVADTDAPATLQNVELLNPHKDVQNDLVADGMRLQLKIVHPGVLHLGFLVPADADAGADAGVDSGDAGGDAGSQLEGVYPAMTIQ